jgi:hypothetical protein
MQKILVGMTFLCAAALGASSFANESLEHELKDRIARAFQEQAGHLRIDKFSGLFFPAGLDDVTTGFADRAINMLAKTHRRDIGFEGLPKDQDFIHIIDGFKYEPNLTPIGYVVLTSPDDDPGNNTKIPFGLHPDGGHYIFPSTIRTLVNADAAPDRQLQMLAMGISHPALTFTGWCDILLSDMSTKRITLDDQGIGNQTKIMRGQKITGCEVVSTSQGGALVLKLMVNSETIFDGRIDSPEKTLVYRP